MLCRDPSIITRNISEMLNRAALRPTRQRIALMRLLFQGSEDRHVTAERLHAEAVDSGEQVSVATVYNTLHELKRAGLVRELAIDGAKAVFDTNTSNHNHFYIERNGQIVDIPPDNIRVDGLPQPPPGMRVSHIDVVVRLVPIEACRDIAAGLPELAVLPGQASRRRPI